MGNLNLILGKFWGQECSAIIHLQSTSRRELHIVSTSFSDRCSISRIGAVLAILVVLLAVLAGELSQLQVDDNSEFQWPVPA